MAKDGLYPRIVALIKAFCANCKSLWQSISLLAGVALSGLADLCKVKSEHLPLYLTIACIAIALILLIRILSRPPSEIYRAPDDDNESDSPILVRIFIGTVLIAVMAGCTWYADQDDPKGWLAEHSTFFANLQSDWGLIKENVARVRENTDKIVDTQSRLVENTDRLVNLQKENIATEARRYLKDKRIDFTAESYARKLAAGDPIVIENFYVAGMDPGVILPDGTAPIFSALLKRTPNHANILQEAMKHGFNPNIRIPVSFNAQLGADPAGLAARIFPQNGLLLEGLQNENIAAGQTEFSIGDFLPLLFIGPNSESKAITDKYGLDVSGGIALRRNFTAAVERIAKRNLNDFNSWGLHEQKLNGNFNRLRDCSGIGELSDEDFRSNPHGQGAMSQPEKIFAVIEKACRTGTVPDRQQSGPEDVRKFVNSRIDQANARYSHFQDRHRQKAGSLHLDEFRSALEKYKAGTEAFQHE